jgi:hypothetical protein
VTNTLAYYNTECTAAKSFETFGRDWNVVGGCWLCLSTEINGRENTLLFNHKKTFYRYKASHRKENKNKQKIPEP